MNFDSFILDDARNMDQYLDDNTVDLSIIKPPYYRLGSDPHTHIKFIRTILEKITKTTKVGGICCLIISDDICKRFVDLSKYVIGSKWIFSENILWVKNSENVTKSLLPMEDVTAVSFDLTPFSTIWIMVKSENDGDYVDLDISNRITKLKISEAKKQEMFDSMWFIPQKSETGYKDYIPKELILRLLMIFSKENDLILDPFTGNGITAVACKTLSRHFICIDKNKNNISISKTRIKNLI